MRTGGSVTGRGLSGPYPLVPKKSGCSLLFFFENTIIIITSQCAGIHIRAEKPSVQPGEGDTVAPDMTRSGLRALAKCKRQRHYRGKPLRQASSKLPISRRGIDILDAETRGFTRETSGASGTIDTSPKVGVRGMGRQRRSSIYTRAALPAWFAVGVSGVQEGRLATRWSQASLLSFRGDSP